MAKKNKETFDKVLGELQSANSSTKVEILQKLSKRLIVMVGSSEVKDLSNRLWAGKDIERNRIAATALAESMVRYAEAPWAMMRVAIGSVHGVGVTKDPIRAIEILSKPMFKGKSAAAYFRSLAHEQLGNKEHRLEQLKEAAELGHPVACNILGLNADA